MKQFGLIGKNIDYSFSRNYFNNKFKQLKLSSTFEYVNFDLKDEAALNQLMNNTPSDVKGFNVTIPYKQAVMENLDQIDEVAKKIGAVNTIKILENGLKKGFNTDCIGFLNTIKPLVKPTHKKALILGTGGASKAIAYALETLGISYKYVSRNPSSGQLSYEELDEKIMTAYTVIVNCSPLGTYPNTVLKPNIPYQFITADHLLYDLIYNPEKTSFLEEGERRGAQIKNGYNMLVEQAESAWEIWNN